MMKVRNQPKLRRVAYSITNFKYTPHIIGREHSVSNFNTTAKFVWRYYGMRVLSFVVDTFHL